MHKIIVTYYNKDVNDKAHSLFNLEMTLRMSKHDKEIETATSYECFSVNSLLEKMENLQEYMTSYYTHLEYIE